MLSGNLPGIFVFLGFGRLVFAPVKEGTGCHDAAVDEAESPELIGGLPQREIEYPGEQNKNFGVHTPILLSTT